MEKVVIISYRETKTGVVLETNVPCKLKGLNVACKVHYVSWDKIGKLLFENYADVNTVQELKDIRKR